MRQAVTSGAIFVGGQWVPNHRTAKSRRLGAPRPTRQTGEPRSIRRDVWEAVVRRALCLCRQGGTMRP